MKNLLVLVALGLVAGCSGNNATQLPTASAPIAPAASTTADEAALMTPISDAYNKCHGRRRFVKRYRILSQGQVTLRVNRGAFVFIGATVVNRFRQTTITAYPLNNNSDDVMTIPEGRSQGEQFDPTATAIRITVPQGSQDSGPGVAVYATSCKPA